MNFLIDKFVTDYSWIHTSIGLAGNLSFFIGSIMFLFESWKHVAIWLFIVGSAGMLIGTLGSAFVMRMERLWRRQHD